MEQELRRMFETRETEMTVPPTLSPELRSRIARQRVAIGGLVAAAAVAVVIGGFAVRSAVWTDAAPVAPAEKREQEMGPPVAPDALREPGWLVYRNGGELVGLDPLAPSKTIALGFGKDIVLVDGSEDGNELVLRKEPYVGDLYVRRADGSETRLTHGEHISDGSFSPDGSIVAFSTDAGISVVDAKGGPPQLLAASDPSTTSWLGGPEWAPDGSRMWFTVDDGMEKIAMWSMNLDGTGRQKVIDLGPRGIDIAWSPDGSEFLITASDGLYAIAWDGSERRFITENRRAADGYPIFHPTWSPDGSQVAFVEYSEYGMPPYDKYSIWVVNADGSERRKVIDMGPRNPSGLVWLPKGSPFGSR